MATNSSKTNKKNTAKNTQATKKSTGRTSSQKTNSAKKRQTVVIEEGLEQENTLRTELILWGALAISLILLLSNFGFGGVVVQLEALQHENTSPASAPRTISS